MAGNYVKDAAEKALEFIFYSPCVHTRTALHWACKRSHVAIVQHLLRNGADVNLLSSKAESVADVTSDSQVLELLRQSELV